MNETPRKLDNERLQTTISMRLCWISSELVTYLGVFWSLASKWWWRETNTKESKESEETQKQVTQLQNYHQECKHTLMKSVAKRKMILNLLRQAYKLHNFSPSSPSAQDQFPISEVCRKHLSLRWSSWRSLKIQLYLNHSNLAKQDLVPDCAFSWTSKTKLLTQLLKSQSVQVPLIILGSVTSKPNSLPLL